MILPKLKKFRLFLIAIALVCIFSINPAKSFSLSYSHYSDKESIVSLLTDFARSQGLKVHISDSVSGVVSGRFDNVDPKLFLQGLHAAFGVKYYRQGNSIFFFDESEWKDAVFRPASMSAVEIIDKLKATGVTVSSLPVVIDNLGNMKIKGPASYVDTVVNTASAIDNSIAEKYVMRVFKLKHAKADDIHIRSMDKTVVVPGIASILQRIVLGGSENIANTTVSINKATVPGLLGTGMSAIGSDNTAPINNETKVVNAGPSIIADSRLNAIIIQDVSYRIPYYAEVIEQLDIPVQLVELHAAIVDVDTDATHNLGIDWRGARKKGKWGAQIGQGKVNVGPDGFPIGAESGGIFSTIFQTTHSSFMMNVNLLEEQNKAKTLGRPSVLTLDNVEATLEDTTTRYVPVAGKDVSDLFKVESGTVLRVTPHIINNEDGQKLISMVISLQSNQDTNDNSLNTSTQGSVVPPIKQTRINTQAVVREGQSLLLGGYYVEYQKTGDSGIPVLKDIPAAGVLFGSKGNDSFRRERLLMITPRILSLDDLNVPAQVDDINFSKNATQADYSNKEAKRIASRADSGGCSSNRNAVMMKD